MPQRTLVNYPDTEGVMRLAPPRQRHQGACHGRDQVFRAVMTRARNTNRGADRVVFLERGPRKRAQLIAKAAEKLVDDESS
jgi:hypothetical protein